MTTLNLTNQQNLANQLAPAMVALRNALVARQPIWDRLSRKKRKVWLQSGKDPIFDMLQPHRSWLMKLLAEVEEAMDDAT